jgi:hypothetical protein
MPRTRGRSTQNEAFYMAHVQRQKRAKKELKKA